MIVLAHLLAARGWQRPITGDFNRHGVRGVARIVGRPHGITKIVIESGFGDRRVAIDRGRHPDPFIARNDLLGRVKTACGQGYDLDGLGIPGTIRPNDGELMFGETEASSFEVIGTGRRFRTIPMSD
jgi:hypothetical protein